MLAPLSNLFPAAIPASRILHLQRAAAMAATLALICTAVIACVPHVAAKVRAVRRVKANRRRFRGR